MPITLCNCGRPARYGLTVDDVAANSCNKYGVCPTYEELREKLTRADKLLFTYRETINYIDDYFEYTYKSKEDQKKVYQLLGNLNDKLKVILGY